MPLLEKIQLPKPPTLREEVYKTLRRKILTGEAPAGTLLNESKLADDIGVSRTPIREAFHKLEMENLIESIPRVGYVVQGITIEDAKEILQIREPLAILAAKWASVRILPFELERLREIIREIDAALVDADVYRIVELDSEFHGLILSASRSGRLKLISRTLRDQMVRFRIQSMSIPDHVRKSNEGHRKILEAIEQKDPEKIEAAYKLHLAHAVKGVIRSAKKDR